VTNPPPEKLADVVDAALRRAATEQQPVLLDASTWIQIRGALRGLPAEPAVLLPALAVARFDVAAADSKEPALELRCTRCDSTICDVVAGDELRPIVRAALTHDEECNRDRAAFINELADAIRAIDGGHQLGAGALAEKLVDGGWMARR
jgi:hypothetical protein